MSTYLQYNNHMILHPTDRSKYLSELVEPIDEVTIGTQTWKMHNLTLDDGLGGIYTNVMSFGHGDQIVRYYTWEAAVRVASKIPGWHLPTKYEWQTLVDYVGGSSVAGTKLKSTFGWPYGGAGTDDYGFEGLPAGSCHPVIDEHGEVTSYIFAAEWINVYYWSATEGEDTLAEDYAYMMELDQLAHSQINYTGKDLAFQIRLIKGDTPPDPPEPPDPPTPTDEVTIGTQTWKNVNLAIDDGQGGIYSRDTIGGTQYYYTWAAAVRVAATVQGWHLPTKEEWETLASTVGGYSIAGTKLKSTTGWESNPGTDDYGFTALPVGYCQTGSGSYSGTRGAACFWTSTEYNIYSSYYSYMTTESRLYWYDHNKTSYAYSVRLIKDS